MEKLLLSLPVQERRGSSKLEPFTNVLAQYSRLDSQRLYLWRRCVGVWDTVGSVYKTVDALHIKDTSLPSSIDVALHALSVQEDREEFRPTLWTAPQGGLGTNQVLKQACPNFLLARITT